MKEINTGGSAFPSGQPFGSLGMSLRDYFASTALPYIQSIYATKQCAEEAYAIADAMLEAREN